MRRSIPLEVTVPVLFASGAPYATFLVQTRASVNFVGGDSVPEDDPRLHSYAFEFSLPSGERVDLSVEIPLRAFGREEELKVRALPVVLPGDPVNVIVAVEATPARELQVKRDRSGRIVGATVEDR